MGMRIAILQSNYIPWKGYFDIINYSDLFIIHDSVQFTKLDWRNRNRIKRRDGPAWLTIPVTHCSASAIENTVVSDPLWARRHWRRIVPCYLQAAHFAELKGWAESLYQEASGERHLSRINYLFLAAICRLLGIKTPLVWSSEYRLVDGRTERLVELCRQVGGTEYLSGPAARAYIDEGLFAEAGIQLTYVDYSGYPEYRQLFPPFDHRVSILDLLFNEGLEATRFMKSFSAARPEPAPGEVSCHDEGAQHHDRGAGV
jgi:hypothetical protein